jgi:hypothetical protein
MSPIDDGGTWLDHLPPPAAQTLKRQADWIDATTKEFAANGTLAALDAVSRAVDDLPDQDLRDIIFLLVFSRGLRARGDGAPGPVVFTSRR